MATEPAQEALPEPSLFDLPDPEASDAPVVEEEAPSAEAEALIAAQQRAEEAEQGQRDAERQRVETLERLLTTPAPAAREEPVDPGAMPDPVEDKEGFARWLDARDRSRSQATQAEIESVRSEVESRQARDTLWNEFQTEHPQYAGAPETVRTAFLMETGGTGKFQGDPADIKRRVANRLKTMARDLGAKTEPAAEPVRTAGVVDASRPKPASAVPKADEDDEPITISGAVSNFQRESGFY